MSEKRPAVIYLLHDKFHFYSPALATVIEFHYVPEFIRDQDIVNSELLENVLKMFITNAKIPPSNVLIIASDSVCYIKDFVNPGPTPEKTPAQVQDELRKQADEFIEFVPFDNVASKIVPQPNGLRVFAANRELLTCIKDAFEKEGSTVDMALPGLFYGSDLSTKPVLEISAANLFLQRMHEFKQHDLLTQEMTHEKKIEGKGIEDEVPLAQPIKKSNTRLFALIGVFAVLIGILGIVIFTSQQPTPPKQPGAVRGTSISVPPPTLIPPEGTAM